MAEVVRPDLDAIEALVAEEIDGHFNDGCSPQQCAVLHMPSLLAYTRALEAAAQARIDAAVAVLREAQASIRGGLPWSYIGVIHKVLAALGADEEATFDV